MHRTLLWSVIAVVAIQSRVSAEDVTWLSEVTQSPANPVMEKSGRIAPLLRTADGQEILTVEQWQQQRSVIESAWRSFLGAMPKPQGLNLTILKSEQSGTVTRQLIEYDAEPGQRVQGYLLRPTGVSGRLPAIVGLHQTTDSSIDEIAGVSGRDAMQLGLKLAQRGFVVMCPRCFLWQDVSSLNHAVAKHRQRNPQALGMAKMLYDAQRAVDVLESLDDVDHNRIGSIGHSLGAKEVLYLAAFDQRIKASVFCEGGIGFRSTNWDAPWYLGSAIQDPKFALNHHQLLALIAPRPFLVIGGESGPGAADGDRSWVLLNAAIPVWKLYSPQSRLGLLNHHQGHAIPEDTFEKMSEWLSVYLRQ
jgi:dienelactone hydrolase